MFVDFFVQSTTEVSEETSTQYLHITEAEDVQGTQAAVAALQDLRYTSENGKIFILKEKISTTR